MAPKITKYELTRDYLFNGTGELIQMKAGDTVSYYPPFDEFRSDKRYSSRKHGSISVSFSTKAVRTLSLFKPYTNE